MSLSSHHRQASSISCRSSFFILPIRRNTLFSTPLTRTFLPSLYKTSLSHLVVVFHDSFSAELAIPHIPLHSAPKAFVKRLPSSLSADKRFIPSESRIYVHPYGICSIKFHHHVCRFLVSDRLVKDPEDRIFGTGRRYDSRCFHTSQTLCATWAGDRVCPGRWFAL